MCGGYIKLIKVMVLGGFVYKVELCPDFTHKALHYVIWVMVGNHFRIQSNKSFYLCM